MDIPRIGSGTLYRPPQAWAGRSAESAVDDSGQPGTVGAPKTDTKPDLKTDANQPAAKPAGGSRAPGEPLSDEQQKQVNKLKAIDTKVRQHEAAHQAAGGGQAGGASFTYQEGPDGKRYAVGGEVPIKSGGGSSPEATIRQLERVKSAALAPADPSGQDLAVAAQATASQAQAQQQLNASRAAEATGQGGGETGAPAESPGAPPPTAPPTGGRPEQSGPGTRASTRSSTGADTGNAAVQDAIVQATAATRALAARGVAAYSAAASVNAAPSHAAVHFA
ncbi:putative metalloprotease CJM1_0395 family protein [Azospirillum sp. sgz301742]